MKRSLIMIAFASLAFLGFCPSASAQYWGYGYYYSPNSFNCLSGCGTQAKVAAWTSLGLSAVDAAVGVHQYSKQLEWQTNQNLYQIEQAKSRANFNQTLQDYQNIMNVAPFFDDDIPAGNTQANQYPSVAPLNPQKSETYNLKK